MHWIIAAPFIHERNEQWLIPFMNGSNSFSTVPASYNHNRSRERTSLQQWTDYLRHGNCAYRTALECRDRAGIITVFPQLAVTVALRKKSSARRIPMVASTFNLGQVYGGIKGRIAKFALKDVDAFVVHSRREMEVYSEWLQLPISRFHFIPLQRAAKEIDQVEDEDSPFVLAMGSAHRDYRLFIWVMGALGYPTIIVAAEHALKELVIPQNVTVMNNLSINQCHSLVQRARVNVLPIDNRLTASGQVTLIEAMMFGKAVVVTNTVGTVDYVNDGVTANLVKPNDADEMANAIQMLWANKKMRVDIGANARQYAIENLSDNAAGKSFSRLLISIK